MQKLTKRKGFNFFRSYYDVYNELSDTDKVKFMDALLDRQFLGKEPEGLTGMARFAYISQTNSIDSQVKGYEDKTKTQLTHSKTPKEGGNNTPTQPPTAPPREGGVNTPSRQVEEKEKEKEVHTLYSEKEFLEDWKSQRETLLKKPTNIVRLSPMERTSLREVIKDFNREQIKNGLEALFRQQVINFTSMHSRPQHYLDHFDKYQTAYDEKDTRLYGVAKKEATL